METCYLDLNYCFVLKILIRIPKLNVLIKRRLKKQTYYTKLTREIS